MVASISLQAANLYGYLRCKAVGEDGQPPPSSSFSGQHLLQRVGDWLRHVVCHCSLQFSISSPVISPPAARHHLWNTMKITSCTRREINESCLRSRVSTNCFHELHLLERLMLLTPHLTCCPWWISLEIMLIKVKCILQLSQAIIELETEFQINSRRVCGEYNLCFD